MHHLASSKAPLPCPLRERARVPRGPAPCPLGPSAPYEGGGRAQPTKPPGRGPPRPRPEVQNALSPSPGETWFHHRREHHSRGTCTDCQTEYKAFSARRAPASLSGSTLPPCPAAGARQLLHGNRRAEPWKSRMRGSSPSGLGFRLNGNRSLSNKSFHPHSQPEERSAKGSAVTPKLGRHPLTRARQPRQRLPLVVPSSPPVPTGLSQLSLPHPHAPDFPFPHIRPGLPGFPAAGPGGQSPRGHHPPASL